MEIQIAVAKTNKYAMSESGDSLEIVERPNGGVSVVLSDGQTSGKGAKAISTMVVRKVISLLAEGVRDGAAARAASDHLFTERNGKVSACLNILSVDFQTGTLVITRNSPVPIFIARGERIECLDVESKPVGTSRHIRPVITEMPLETGCHVILYTDGITHAGDRTGERLDVCTLLTALIEEREPTSQALADAILSEALRLDQNRANDDMSVVVLQVTPNEPAQIRRMTVSLPVPPTMYQPIT